MTVFSEAALRHIINRVVHGVARDDFQAPIKDVVQQWFGAPEKGGPWSTPENFASIAIDIAKSQRGTVRLVTGGKRVIGQGSNQKVFRVDQASTRTLWRYHKEQRVGEFISDVNRVFWCIFHAARIRFRLFQRGYQVSIDETQTTVFVRDPSNDDELMVDITDLQAVTSASKDDKWSGKFRALTYHMMVGRCNRSGIILPMGAHFIATHGEKLPDYLRCPNNSPEKAMKALICILEAYIDPQIIMFDRGYHANLNYARVDKYCRGRKTFYLTPAKRDPGALTDGEGEEYSSFEKLIKAGLAKAKRILGTQISYLKLDKPIKGHPNETRTLIIFYRPKDESRDMPNVAIRVGTTHWAAPFYTNHKAVDHNIRLLEEVYADRWAIENWFKTRSTCFHSGRAHRPLRRLFMFMLGVFMMAIYALFRGKYYPTDDRQAVNDNFCVPQFLVYYKHPPDPE